MGGEASGALPEMGQVVFTVMETPSVRPAEVDSLRGSSGGPEFRKPNVYNRILYHRMEFPIAPGNGTARESPAEERVNR